MLTLADVRRNAEVFYRDTRAFQGEREVDFTVVFAAVTIADVIDLDKLGALLPDLARVPVSEDVSLEAAARAALQSDLYDHLWDRFRAGALPA